MNTYFHPACATAMTAVFMLTGQAAAQDYNIARRLARQAVASAEARPSDEQPADGQPTSQAPSPAAAPQDTEPLTVEQIVQKTNYVSYYQGADGRAQVRMTITDQQGQKRNREFTILRRDDRKGDVDDADFIGDQKFYVYFRAPADVNRMVFMVHKRVDRDDDRWLYMPGLDLVRRIAAADKRTSFVGSHFLYEDVSGRSINDDTHELLEDESDATYYVLKNTPKQPDSVEFSHFRMWIHRRSFIVVRTVYYDKQPDPKPYRQYDALEVKPDEKLGYFTVTRSRMTDLLTGGHTELEYADVTYNIDLPEELFSERFLRRAPLNYLQ